MNNKYSRENVQIGDRVLVSGCGTDRDRHWGTVLGYLGNASVNVRMDDSTLRSAKTFNIDSELRCYRAYWDEVHDLVTPLAEDERVSLAECEGAIEPNPLQKVIEDLTATHRYLEQVTGKKYSVQLKGFDLESGNGYDSNEVAIKFLMEVK